MDLLADTLAQVRGPAQRFVLLEGLCNSSKLARDDDRCELRVMDEFFAIERAIGEVQAVIGLQFNSDKEALEEDEIVYERFEQTPASTPRVEAKPEGEEAPAEQPPAKKAAFRPEDWKWTAMDRHPRNLVQLFLQAKGPSAKHELRTAEQFSSSQYEAISKSLDEFAAKLVAFATSDDSRYLYQQIIFTE